MRTEENINHVLLADDDPDHAFLFQRVLKQVDPSAQLSVVSNGTELLEFLDKQVPDLLFLDLNMPCKSGYECLVEIRDNLMLSSLLIVVYSSSSNMPDIAKCYEYNADLYMVKPFNSLHLKNALESILNMEWKMNHPNERFYFINNKFVPFTA